ncbi:MAG: hypothetical protein FWE02_05980 [Defluviitaleaceae bacterium]|nr:hypothetical protein [Defluviitaleaceae bacterium]
MRYFIMEQNRRIPNPIEFNLNGASLKLKRPFTILNKEIKENIAVDLTIQKVLFDYHFFLSTELMKVLAMYDNSIIFWPVFIADENEKLSYFRLSMDTTDDISDLENKPIHLIYRDKQAFLLVNLYVAESILRRYPIGITFKEWFSGNI